MKEAIAKAIMTSELEKKRGELDSDDQFRKLIEQAPVAIGLTRNGMFIYVNKKHLEMFGYSDADELIGRPIFIFSHPRTENAGKGGIAVWREDCPKERRTSS